MSLPQVYGITSLINYLVGTYFAHLTSVLIVYDANQISNNAIQQQYLDDVQQGFENQSRNANLISLQWINILHLNDTADHFGEEVLNAVDIGTIEGFITILGNTSRFLHARYYATRYSTLRLKDKIYLFLCDSKKNPKDFLANELLQFYPHHLMVIPETVYPDCNNDHNQQQQYKNVKTKGKTAKQNIKHTSLARRITSNKLKVTNVTSKMVVAATTAATRKTTSLFSFSYNNLDVTKNYKYRDINFELWTQQYVGAEGNLNAIQLDTYISGNGSFAKNVHLYPNKILNLQQRTMRIGTLTYAPYVTTSYVAPGEGDVDPINSLAPPKIVYFKGSEAEITKTFCVIHNCHLRVEPYAADNWGFIHDNGSAGGMLGDVYKQHTEMAIGCIYNWYNDITETSQFIARSAVTILGPGPAKFPRWRTVIMPFSNGLWLFLVFTIIMCSIIFHIIKYVLYISHQNFERSLLDIFAIFIQQPSADTILHHMTTRIFLAFLLCATITLENTYSGQLKSLLTTPLFSEPIDTMQKWSLTGWRWAAPSIIWIHTVEDSDLAKEQRLAKQFEVRDHEFMSNAIFRDDYGFGLERIYSGTFTFGDYITRPALENKIIPKDDLYFDWTRAVAIRGWPLMPLLDLHILFCLETGLFSHWEKQFSYEFLDHQIQDILKKLASGAKPKSPPQMLSIEHISGPLFILLFGYVSAIIVFIAEVFGRRMTWDFHKLVVCFYAKYYFK